MKRCYKIKSLEVTLKKLILNLLWHVVVVVERKCDMADVKVMEISLK